MPYSFAGSQARCIFAMATLALTVLSCMPGLELPTATTTPIATATNTPPPTPTVTAAEMDNWEIVAKVPKNTEDLEKLPFVAREDIESGAFSEFILRNFEAGKLGEFPQYAKPFKPTLAIQSTLVKKYGYGPAIYLPEAEAKKATYTDLTQRPMYVTPAYFVTELEGTKYLLYSQLWLNVNGKIGTLTYIFPYKATEQALTYFVRLTKPDTYEITVPFYYKNGNAVGEDYLEYSKYWTENQGQIRQFFEQWAETGNFPPNNYLFFGCPMNA